jgi:hypothetical protein
VTWPLRLAALGCLAAACAVTAPLNTLGLILAAVALFLASSRGRAPWCWCGHDRAVHEHYTSGSYCSRCRCPKFSAPILRRTR